MIYKNLNNSIQDKIDNIIKTRHKQQFKNSLLMDLLAYHVKNNMDFIKSYLIY